MSTGMAVGQWQCAQPPAHTAAMPALLDLVLPERCAACGRPARGLCGTCVRDAVGLRLADGAPAELAPGVLAVAGYLYDGAIADAIRGIKRPGCHAPARWLGAMLWAEVTPRLGAAAGWPRTWVPSSRARLRARGAEIPQLLAGDGACPLLRRVRQTGQQKQRTARERRAGAAGDFVVRASVPRRVVLVDDVRTTGATARAAASALRVAGADHVLVVTLAAVPGPATADADPVFAPGGRAARPSVP